MPGGLWAPPPPAPPPSPIATPLYTVTLFHLDGDSYVDMDSVLCNNPAPDINASKAEALQVLKLILGNNSMTIFDTQKNVDSTDGKIVILKPF